MRLPLAVQQGRYTAGPFYMNLGGEEKEMAEIFLQKRHRAQPLDIPAIPRRKNRRKRKNIGEIGIYLLKIDKNRKDIEVLFDN